LELPRSVKPREGRRHVATGATRGSCPANEPRARSAPRPPQARLFCISLALGPWNLALPRVSGAWNFREAALRLSRFSVVDVLLPQRGYVSQPRVTPPDPDPQKPPRLNLAKPPLQAPHSLAHSHTTQHPLPAVSFSCLSILSLFLLCHSHLHQYSPTLRLCGEPFFPITAHRSHITSSSVPIREIRGPPPFPAIHENSLKTLRQDHRIFAFEDAFMESNRPVLAPPRAAISALTPSRQKPARQTADISTHPAKLS
jgi:hypothetical protein